MGKIKITVKTIQKNIFLSILLIEDPFFFG